MNGAFINANGIPLQIGDNAPSFTMDFNEELTWGPFRLSGSSTGTGAATSKMATTGTSSSAASGAIRRTRQHMCKKRSPTWNRECNRPRSSSCGTCRSATRCPPVDQSRGGWSVSSARLSLLGRNLLYWYSKYYDGLDPETSTAGSQDVRRNSEITPYPPARSFFLSLDLGL